MIKFERYTHVNDFIDHYIPIVGNGNVRAIVNSGVSNEADAKIFTSFIIAMVDAIHRDAENQIPVFGYADNTDILSDISYEVTSYMRKTPYFSIWDDLFNQ
jgi:hypothetical protein